MKKVLSVVLVMIFFFTPIQNVFAYEATNRSYKPENESTIYSFLTDIMGMNSAAACGVIANLYCESGFDPNVTGDNDTSYGMELSRLLGKTD